MAIEHWNIVRLLCPQDKVVRGEPFIQEELPGNRLMQMPIQHTSPNTPNARGTSSTNVDRRLFVYTYRSVCRVHSRPALLPSLRLRSGNSWTFYRSITSCFIRSQHPCATTYISRNFHITYSLSKSTHSICLSISHLVFVQRSTQSGSEIRKVNGCSDSIYIILVKKGV